MLNQGKLPCDWKTATVVVVYKKSSHTDPANYRPISLTCICSKIIRAQNIFSYVYRNMKTATTLSARNNVALERIDLVKHTLLETINDLAMGLNNGKLVDGLLLDFSQSFTSTSFDQTVTLWY